MKTLTILFFFALYTPIAFSQNSQKVKLANGFRDTMTFEILTFSRLNHKPFLFDTTCVDANLSATELQLVEELFFKGIENAGSIPINIKTYFKQLVPVITKKRRQKGLH